MYKHLNIIIYNIQFFIRFFQNYFTMNELKTKTCYVV